MTATTSPAELQTFLIGAWSQISEGDAPCDMCGESAQVTLTIDPDYDNTPMCWKHARHFLMTMRDLSDHFWGKP